MESFEIQLVALIKIINLYFYLFIYVLETLSVRVMYQLMKPPASLTPCWRSGGCFSCPPQTRHHQHHLTTPFPPGLSFACVAELCVEQSGALCQPNSSPFVAGSQLYTGACDDFMEKKKKKATSCHR